MDSAYSDIEYFDAEYFDAEYEVLEVDVDAEDEYRPISSLYFSYRRVDEVEVDAEDEYRPRISLHLSEDILSGGTTAMIVAWYDAADNALLLRL